VIIIELISFFQNVLFSGEVHNYGDGNSN